MAISGHNIIVYMLNGSTWEPIAATKSDHLQTSCGMIEISDANEQEWQRVIAGRKSWGLQTSWLATVASDIRKVLLVGQRVKLRIKSRGASDANAVTGFALIQTVDVSTQEGNLANGSFAFTGDGALE